MVKNDLIKNNNNMLEDEINDNTSSTPSFKFISVNKNGSNMNKLDIIMNNNPISLELKNKKSAMKKNSKNSNKDNKDIPKILPMTPLTLAKKISFNNVNTNTNNNTNNINDSLVYSSELEFLKSPYMKYYNETEFNEDKEEMINFKAMNLLGLVIKSNSKKPTEVAEKLASKVLEMIRYFSLDKHKKQISKPIIEKLFESYDDGKEIDRLANELAVRQIISNNSIYLINTIQ